MPSKLASAALAVALGAAINFTTVGKAFAIWCQADAVTVYQNMVTNFMPFVSKLVGATGLSIEGAVVQSSAGVRGEIAKSTLATKAVTEGIEAYEQQEALRDQAQDMSESLRQPATTCTAIATSNSLSGADQSAQVSAMASQSWLLNRVSVAGNTNTVERLDQAFRASSTNFCTPEEEAAGICQQRMGRGRNAGADRNALSLFQGSDGSSSIDSTSGPANSSDAYLARVLGQYGPQALAQQGRDYYQRSPQARAYVELSRRYNAMLSASAYSLQQVKEMHKPQLGLGNDTLLATVPGFTPNKADMSMAEAIERFVATKFSPESVRDLATATKPHVVLRDMAQMQAFQLWMGFQALQQGQRMESLQAHELVLEADQTLRPQIDAQRVVAARANAAAQ